MIDDLHGKRRLQIVKKTRNPHSCRTCRKMIPAKSKAFVLVIEFPELSYFDYHCSLDCFNKAEETGIFGDEVGRY